MELTQETIKCRHTLKLHRNLLDIKYIDDDQLASSSDDGLIKIWNINTGRCEKTLQTWPAHQLIVLSDRRLVAALECQSKIQIWDLNTWESKELTTDGDVVCFEVLGNGMLACAEFKSKNDGAVEHNISFRVGKKLHFNVIKKVEKAHDDGIECLRALPGKRLASGSQGGDIRIWTKEAILESKLEGHLGWIKCLMHADKKLFSCSSDKTIRIWDYEDAKCLHVIKSVDVIERMVEVSQGFLMCLAGGFMKQRLKLYELKEFMCIDSVPSNALHADLCIENLIVTDKLSMATSAQFEMKIFDISSGLRDEIKQEYFEIVNY